MGRAVLPLDTNLLERPRRALSPAGLNRSGGVLWLPALLVAAVILLPVFYLLLRVVGGGPGVWEVLLNANLLPLMARTAGLALAVALASALIALPLAWLSVRTDLPLRRLWGLLAALPLVIPSYVGAYLFIAFLGPRGMLAQGLENTIGLERLPSIYGFPGAFIVLTLLSYPYTFLSVRAGLLRLDAAQEEAARSLGCGAWRTFWRVTLPHLGPSLAAGSLLVVLYVLRDFGAVSLLRYDTFTRVIYIQYKSSFDRSSAAALSLVLVAMTLAVLWLDSRIRRRSHSLSANASGPRPPAVVRLGAWRWPALAFSALVACFALLLPAGVLLYWLVRGWQVGEIFSPLWGAVRNSFLASALAAGAALLAALPISILNVRRPGRWSHLLERLSYSAYALPGIVVALSLVYFGANYARPIYGTLAILVMAYLVLFLSQAVGAIRASLLQMPPSLEEAARSLGRRPLQVFSRITLPLIQPGILSGAGLVFLTAMKELPATLILSPFGFSTLATTLWSAVSEAFFARAALPALLMILVSSLPLTLLFLKENR